MNANSWILQTYFYWHGVEERGFSRSFDTRQQAEDYARNTLCGHRHTISESHICGYCRMPLGDGLHCQNCGGV